MWIFYINCNNNDNNDYYITVIVIIHLSIYFPFSFFWEPEYNITAYWGCGKEDETTEHELETCTKIHPDYEYTINSQKIFTEDTDILIKTAVNISEFLKRLQESESTSQLGQAAQRSGIDHSTNNNLFKQIENIHICQCVLPSAIAAYVLHLIPMCHHMEKH